MSMLIHCDGPGCRASRNPLYGDDRLGTPGWLALEQYGSVTMHFHNRTCLAKWAGEFIIPVKETV